MRLVNPSGTASKEHVSGQTVKEKVNRNTTVVKPASATFNRIKKEPVNGQAEKEKVGRIPPAAKPDTITYLKNVNREYNPGEILKEASEHQEKSQASSQNQEPKEVTIPNSSDGATKSSGSSAPKGSGNS